jgi:hypothetical protein
MGHYPTGAPTELLTYSVALVRKRTIPIGRPPLVGEVRQIQILLLDHKG